MPRCGCRWFWRCLESWILFLPVTLKRIGFHSMRQSSPTLCLVDPRACPLPPSRVSCMVQARKGGATLKVSGVEHCSTSTLFVLLAWFFLCAWCTSESRTVRRGPGVVSLNCTEAMQVSDSRKNFHDEDPTSAVIPWMTV